MDKNVGLCLFMSKFQMVFDKRAAIYVDFKWSSLQISDLNRNQDHLKAKLFVTIQNLVMSGFGIHNYLNTGLCVWNSKHFRILRSYVMTWIPEHIICFSDPLCIMNIDMCENQYLFISVNINSFTKYICISATNKWKCSCFSESNNNMV